MGYLIGAGPLDPAVKRYDGGTSSFTMDNSGTTNGTLLWVDGVAQVPGTDYNVSGTTITTTTAAAAGTNTVVSLQLFNTGLITTPADNTVTSAKIVDGTIVAADLADDAVTLAKMVAGTDGNIISYDASGNPVAVATGNDGQVLTSSGAGAVCAFEDAGGGGKIVQVVNTSVTAGSNGTTTMNYDDTIPQNTEGTEFLTRAITPTSATNKLLILVNSFLQSAGGNQMIAAIFQDSTAGALAANSAFWVANQDAIWVMSHYMTAGTTSSTTFKFRAGTGDAGTTYQNGNSTRRMGGVGSSSMTIWEIEV